MSIPRRLAAAHMIDGFPAAIAARAYRTGSVACLATAW